MPEQEKKYQALNRKFMRERMAREEAERILESKSREIFEINCALKGANQNLDHIVAERTTELKQSQLEAEQKSIELSKSLERIELVVHAANAIIWDWSIIDNQFDCSFRIELELGYGADAIKTISDFTKLIHEDDYENAIKSLNKHIELNDKLDINCRLRQKSQNYRWFHIIGQAIRDKNNNALRVVGSIIDINERIESEKTIQKMAHYDALTDIPNRSSFNQSFSQIILHSTQSKAKFALFIVDLNDFKIINDRYGHEAGDRLLCHVATILASQTKGYDVIARLGGDEFAVILNNLSPTANLEQFCENLFKNFAAPINFSGQNLFANLSIGISTFPEHGKSIEKLMRCADIAMYSAKQDKLKGSAFTIYHPKLDKDRNRRTSLRDEIENAIKETQFSLVFQPCYDLNKNRLCSGEALLRWPAGSQVRTIAEVIAVAEESGLILKLSEWIIDQACQFIAALEAAGFEHQIGINLSAIQFQYQNIPKIIKESIKRHNINPTHLQVEVTENLFLDNMRKAVQILEELHDLGLDIYIDDFGTGYSNLTYLQMLPVDWVKIDKSFIDALDERKESQQIITAVVNMMHSMNRKVVAEGVEYKEQYDFLDKIGCDVIQGYFISKPLQQKDYISNLIEFEKPKSARIIKI